MEIIRWRKCTYPGIRKNLYIISEDGDLMNIVTLHRLTKDNDKDGYIKYSVVGETRRCFHVFAHRLVAYQFCENPYNLPVVDHLDGSKTHNHYTNLEWVTVKENTHRAEAMNLRKVRGANNGNSKYSEEFVRSVCERYQNGQSLKEVFQWAVNDSTALSTSNPALYYFLYRLKKREIWPDVVPEYNYDTSVEKVRWTNPVPQSANYKFPESVIRKACAYLESGFTALDTVEKLTGARSTSSPYYTLVMGIRSGRIWKHISKDYDIDPNKTTDRYRGWDEKVARMVDEGLSKQDIRQALGIMRCTDAPKEAGRINRMIDRYKAFKKIDNTADIQILDE